MANTIWYKVIKTSTNETLFIGQSYALTMRIVMRMGWRAKVRIFEMK